MQPVHKVKVKYVLIYQDTEVVPTNDSPHPWDGVSCVMSGLY